MRVGDTVRRPWAPHTEGVHAWLRHVRAAGFTAVPEPLDRDDDGREVLAWVDGDVAVPPYPQWACTDEYLVSVAELLRAMHDASAGFDPTPYTWNDELQDPIAGPTMCHSDLCLENLVARDGRVVAFLDFDFLAPGRVVTDVVATARFVVPLRSPARRNPWLDEDDVLRRLRLFVDVYGLSEVDRAIFADVLEQRRANGEQFVLNRARRGEALFADWLKPAGAEKLRAERAWIVANHDRITTALVDHGQL